MIDLTHRFHRIKHKIQRFVFGEILQTLLAKLLPGHALLNPFFTTPMLLRASNPVSESFIIASINHLRSSFISTSPFKTLSLAQA